MTNVQEGISLIDILHFTLDTLSESLMIQIPIQRYIYTFCIIRSCNS